MDKTSIRGLLLVVALIVVAATGCVGYHYIVPAAVIQAYNDPLPVQGGFMMNRELRDQWYRKRSVRTRVDVPVGKVTLDLANSYLAKAFKVPAPAPKPGTQVETTDDFYTIRYYDRRSEKGILIILTKIEYELLEAQTVSCALTVSIEDAAGNAFISKRYEGVGSPHEGAGLLQKTIYQENLIELSTAAAYRKIFSAMLSDIRTSLGR